METPCPTPPDDTGSALVEQSVGSTGWAWVLIGCTAGLAGVAFGIATKHAAVMCCGFLVFALALGCSDGPVDERNAAASDALNREVR